MIFFRTAVNSVSFVNTDALLYAEATDLTAHLLFENRVLKEVRFSTTEYLNAFLSLLAKTDIEDEDPTVSITEAIKEGIPEA